jgi:Raf kinase inhibitor-like YbhB/YbcL family protein
MSLIVRSPAFAFGDPIPARYTADGEDISPPLEWSAPPDGTVELALIMEDPDAPGAEPWIHWILYKIPADAPGLPEGIPTTPTTSDGLVQGENSWGSIGYSGPAPPPSHHVHHYHFHLFALDEALDATPGLDVEALQRAMAGHTLTRGELVGTYRR